MLILLLAVIDALVLILTYGKGRGIAPRLDGHSYVSFHMAVGNESQRRLHLRKLPGDDRVYCKNES